MATPPNMASADKAGSLTIAETLERAADRLEKPGAWTQGYMAEDADGNRCGPTSPFAVCWCSSGAITAEVEAADLARREARRMLRRVVGPYITEWNDHPSRTQEEVVSAFRAAAALARKEGR